MIIPVAEFRDLVGAAHDRDALGRRSGDRIEEGARAVPADPGAQREGVSDDNARQLRPRRETDAAPGREWRPPSYWPFVVPALVVVLAIIVFPWLFTIWMSLNEWKVGSPTTFVGLANYLRLPNDPRFVEAVGHTILYTALSVLLPLMFGTFAAVVFHQKFAVRGFLRGVFIMPMMATPGGDRAGLDHDVPPAARRAELSAVAGRPAAAALGVSPGDRDPFAGAGRDLAMDAAGDADRARRPRRDPDRALRKRADRRRQFLADVPLHHAAADHAVPVHRRR